VDATDGSRSVEILGFARLVRNPSIYFAEAGTVDQGFYTVIEKPKTHSLANELLITLLFAEIKQVGKTGAPSLELVVHCVDDELNPSPRIGHCRGTVEGTADVMT